MKKGFLLFVMAMMSMASFGQENRMQYYGGKVEDVSSPQQAKASTRATEGDEVPWGYNLQDKVSGYEIGRNAIGEYSAAIFVPGDGILKGAKVSSVAVPSTIDGMRNVKVWIRESLVGEDVATAEIPSIDKRTYAKATLSQEYEIPEKGFYVGYTFNSPETYPILFSGEDNVEACWLKCPGEDWMDLYGYGYGSVSIQLYVTGKEFPENNLSFTLNKSSIIALAGGQSKVMFKIKSNSVNDITNFELSINNGEKQHYNVINLSNNPIKAGLGRNLMLELPFDIPTSISAKNSVTFSIVEVNGEPNYNTAAKAKLIVKTGTEGGIRRTLVEENTGTGCGWCPIGMAAMETMNELHGDKFIGIALHQFNSKDPMYLSRDNYYDLGMYSAPASMIDRTDEIYPAYLESVFDEYNNIPPLANVDVNGYWNEDGTAVEVTSNIDVKTNDLLMRVAYVLVADGLTTNKAEWCQYNYFYEDDPDDYIGDWLYEKIKEFCSGGKYGTNLVSGLVFNDVAVSTSYVGRQTEIPVYLDVALGDKITNRYTLKYNASEELKSVVDPAKTSIVVILEDEDGNVINAAKAPVLSYSAGIDNAIGKQDGARRIYTIDGRAKTKFSKGINIVVMPDGTVRKMIK